jgi:hypothetical protein
MDAMRWLLVVGLLAGGIGCGGVANSGAPDGTHEPRGDGGQGSLPDVELGGSAGTSTEGGSAGTSAKGGSVGTSKGGARALAGNGGADAGNDDVGVGGYTETAGIADFGGCVSDLSGAPGGPGDAISVHGHAGVLGDVDFTIWGYSAGSGSDHGVNLSTSGQGQKGTPSGIDEVHLTVWALPDTAVEGRIYPRDPSQLELRISAASPITTVGCMDATDTGSFAFSRLSDRTTDGVYQLDCPASDIRVYGCFHYVH